MDPQSLVIVLRMAERILGVLLGGLLIYFAYRLFLNLPSKRGRESGSGDFSFAGGNKIKLSKVGPGVFFALFGAGLIVFSLTRSVSLTVSPPTAKTKTGKPEVMAASTFKFIGAVSVPENAEDRARMRIETKRDIAALNRALDHAAATEQPDIEHAVTTAKLALMEPLWAEDWGDLADFRAWLEKRGPPPSTIQPAVDFFQQK